MKFTQGHLYNYWHVFSPTPKEVCIISRRYGQMREKLGLVLKKWREGICIASVKKGKILKGPVRAVYWECQGRLFLQHYPSVHTLNWQRNKGFHVWLTAYTCQQD